MGPTSARDDGPPPAGWRDHALVDTATVTVVDAATRRPQAHRWGCSARPVSPRTSGSNAPPRCVPATRNSSPPPLARLDRPPDASPSCDDIEHARALLVQHPDLYRNHLTIAKFIEGWIERLVNDATSTEFNDGFVEAFIDLITHLRDGDFLTQSGAEFDE